MSTSATCSQPPVSRTGRSIAILVLGTVFCACAITPLVYSGLEWMLGTVEWPFSRVFDRVAMFFLFVFLLIYGRDLNVGRVKQFLKAGTPGIRWKGFLLGLALSLSMVALLLPLVVSGPEIVWSANGHKVLSKTPKIILSGLVVASIEEVFFRVILLQTLLARMAFPAAALASSLIYASVHFVSPVSTYQYPGFDFLVGFQYLEAVFERALNPKIFPAFLGLLLVGLILAVAIQRSGSLFLCVGLHMGWVIAIKFARFLTVESPGYVFPAAAGKAYFFVAQPLGWISILLTGVLVMLSMRFVAVQSVSGNE